jgi:hypothetical protein
VPLSYAATSLSTYLDVASGFTLKLLSFSSYGKDSSTWVDYNVLDDPVAPDSWMWARFSEDRAQVNVGFREPHDISPDGNASLFGPILVANRRAGRRRELIRLMRIDEAVFVPPLGAHFPIARASAF